MADNCIVSHSATSSSEKNMFTGDNPRDKMSDETRDKTRPESQPSHRMLPREEYIEQAYFFKALCERLSPEEPVQSLLASMREEVLVTT